MMMLRAYGYSDVRNLVGGLQAWQAEGYPVAGQPSP
jgi:3-mercaptopyruvate sulfurtransferase SseA